MTITQFLRLLARVPGRWYLQPPGHEWARAGVLLCGIDCPPFHCEPVTALAWSMGLLQLDRQQCGQQGHTAYRLLGLAEDDYIRLWQAADNEAGHDVELRAELLAAVGLAVPRVPGGLMF